MFVDMMSATGIRPMCVLYGSQTGNAQQIARMLSEELAEKTDGLVECSSLDERVKNLSSLSSLSNVACLLIVCSTTGNGDVPENASKFWRAIKSRKCEKTLFAGVRYAVLGLGDTNYDKFCYMGKQINKRVDELSGEQLLPLCCADEAIDMEEVVETWMQTVIDKVITDIRPQPIAFA